MGNAPSTDYPQPQNPFKASRNSSVVENVRPRPKSKPSVLQQLILRQDWQRVLIRINLFPAEVRHYLILPLAQAELLVLPLHLVCALDPPVLVIEVLLHHYVEAAALPIQTISSSQNNVSASKRNKLSWTPRLGQRVLEWKLRRQGAFPVDTANTQDKKIDDQQVLLPKNKLSQRLSEEKTEFYSTKQHLEDEINLTDGEKSSPSSSSSSLSSKQSWEQKKGVILQLSPSGGLKPMPIQLNATDDTSTSNNSTSVFRVRWDLEPLIEHVSQQGQLLPLHIACLYRSSDKVVQMLVDSYPSVALSPVLGMLPIHWVAAGWTLPPPVLHSPPPPPPAAVVVVDVVSLLPSTPKPGPLPLLKVLRKASYESLRVQSGNHSMTPLEYIEECLEEGEYKEACIEVLSGESRDVGSIGSVTSIVFVDSDDMYHGTTSSAVSPLTHDAASSSNSNDNNKSNSKELVACITALIADRNWEQVLALVEDDPSLAGYWLYGVDHPNQNDTATATTTTTTRTTTTSTTTTQHQQQQLQPSMMNSTTTNTPVIWKRLPIHLACREQAPVGLISVLLEAYPAGATTADPQSGELPLHTAVRHAGGESAASAAMAGSSCSLAVVQSLLQICPEATMAVDGRGQVPLHKAVIGMASYAVVEALIEQDPHSVAAVDGAGQTPMDYAKRLQGSNSLITELVETVLLFQQQKQPQEQQQHEQEAPPLEDSN